MIDSNLKEGLLKFKSNGRFLMLALDHRGSFKKYVKPENPEAATDDEVIEIKKLIIEALEDQFSGVLVDPDWGLPAYTKASAGKSAKPFLLCLEKSGYTDEKGERKTELQYSAKQLKEWGASGVKLLVYFNPEASNRDYQLEVSRKALEDSRANGLPLFLEIVTYGNDELGKTRSEWVLRSLETFIKAGVVPDVWKLEYPASAEASDFAKATPDKPAGKPGDLEACKKITKLVGKTPWIILTRGDSFEHFKHQLKDAIAGGAVGFLAGRALWQEIKDRKTDKEKQEFLNVVVKKRFEEIARICLSS